ncbi:MAG: PAS domain S-box protein [Rhodoferax sp.]|nr:PAS domain S-box protein [Rhodoferax sp.]
MKFIALTRRSLVTRITLVSLAIFVISMWSMALYTGRMLRQDMQQLLGEQQFSTAALLAEEINQELMYRLHGLEELALAIGPRHFADPTALRGVLLGNPLFLDLFNGGAFVTQHTGVAIASVPDSAQRVGVSFMERDHIVAALQHGKPAISEPVIGKMLKAPVVSMAAPIRDGQGKVIGALVGVTVLSNNNFLDRLIGHRYGRSGGYLLLDPKHRRYVSDTGKRHVLAPLPAPGVNPLNDRYAPGTKGFGVDLDANGVEHLSAGHSVPASGWTVVVILPTEEAFSPIESLQRRLLHVAALLTVLMALLSWWMLGRELRPLRDTADQLTALRDSKKFPQALPVTRSDEIGQVIGGFNRLLEVLHQREFALQESEERFRTLVEWTPEAIAVHVDGKLVFVNPAAVRLLGAASAADLQGQALMNFVHPDSQALANEAMTPNGVEDAGLPPTEYKFVTMDGVCIDVEVAGIAIKFNGQAARQIAIYNITERKNAEQRLRQLSRITEQAPIAIVITDLLGAIEYVNPKFTEVTGYLPEEVMGRNPRVLQSGMTSAATYIDLWNVLQTGSIWRGEFRNRKKNGDLFVEQAVIAPVQDTEGNATHYVALKEDITVFKHSQQRLERLMLEQKAMLENDLVGIVRVVGDTVLWANPALEAMLGFTPGEIIGMSAGKDFFTTQAFFDMAAAATPVLKAGGIFRHQIEYVRRDGSHIWVDLSGAALYPHSRESLWACLDVSKSVQTEAALQASLVEKTALLNEVHHRVKNNLQVITSLLRLEEARTTQIDTRSVLQDMQGRIRSMALVHETLYRSGSFASVGLHQYLQQVASLAFRAQTNNGSAVRLTLELSPVTTSLDQATPCGLLVNELISNSLKHGFIKGQEGEVRVVLQPLASGSHPSGKPLWTLSVSDTGSGLPPDFELRRNQSLGLQLVSDLVRQLKGELQVRSGPGTAFTLHFPIEKNP